MPKRPKISKFDQRTAVIVSILAVITGFVIYKSFASTSLLYTYEENESGIRHSNGSRKFDSYASKSYAWEAVNASGYSWWGPYKDGQKAGKYKVCYYMRTMQGGYAARAYVDVRKPGAVVKSAQVSPLPDAEGGSAYDPACIEYSLSATTNDLEWRVDVREGKIRIDRVRVYKIN